MRRLASFRKHVEGLELEKQAELLTCPNAAKEEIGKLLNELQQQVLNLSFSLLQNLMSVRVLKAITKSF